MFSLNGGYSTWQSFHVTATLCGLHAASTMTMNGPHCGKVFYAVGERGGLQGMLNKLGTLPIFYLPWNKIKQFPSSVLLFFVSFCIPLGFRFDKESLDCSFQSWKKYSIAPKVLLILLLKWCRRRFICPGCLPREYSPGQ